MNKLQIALALNAIFSSISGGILLFFSKAKAQTFDVPASKPFWIIGIALLFFAATLVYEIRQQNPLRVLWIIIQDFLWVIGSIILILFNPFSVSSLGLWIIAAVAFVVLLMAINQITALALVDDHTTKGDKILQFHRQNRR